MKKVLAILPLMTAVFLAPSCKVTIGWDDTAFTYDASINGANATVKINWVSGAHLSFKTDKLEFIPDNEAIKVAEIKYEDGSSTISPMTVIITFEEGYEHEFGGLLNYTYTNIDTSANGDNQQEITFTPQNN